MTKISHSPLNWSAASRDYAEHRPGYPDGYFHLLSHLGIGLPGQTILDIGSGTGALAIPFARQGAEVTAVDLSVGQIREAQVKAAEENLSIRFVVAPAEEAPLEKGRFDVVTASMCWGYFDRGRILEQIRRVLRPGGLLLISSIIWSGDETITRETNSLIARYNDRFTLRETEREEELDPSWAREGFVLRSFHRGEAPLPFTRESWRGRMRATKFIGAALPPETVEAFDREHAAILEKAPERFDINHSITIRVFQFSEGRQGS